MPGYNTKECMKIFLAWLKEDSERIDGIPNFENMLWENPTGIPKWLVKWEDELSAIHRAAIFFASWKSGYREISELPSRELVHFLLGMPLPDQNTANAAATKWRNQDPNMWKSSDFCYFYWVNKKSNAHSFFIPSVTWCPPDAGLGSNVYFYGTSVETEQFSLKDFEGRRKTFLHNIQEATKTPELFQEPKWLKETLEHQERQFNALEKIKLAETCLAELRSELEAAEVCKATHLDAQRVFNDLMSAMNLLVWQGGKMVGQTREESRLLFEQGLQNKKPKIGRARKILAESKEE